MERICDRDGDVKLGLRIVIEFEVERRRWKVKGVTKEFGEWWGSGGGKRTGMNRESMLVVTTEMWLSLEIEYAMEEKWKVRQ